MNVWLLLMIAILLEVLGTSALKASDGFTRLWPSLTVLLGYSGAFYLLSLTLKQIPIGVAYAVWSGTGVALITMIGWLVFGQQLRAPALAGIALIVSGVIVLNVYGGVHAPDAYSPH